MTLIEYWYSLSESDKIALYAAVLSTILFINQIVLWFNNRFKLEIGYRLNDKGENYIIVCNLSQKPIIILSHDFYFGKNINEKNKVYFSAEKSKIKYDIVLMPNDVVRIPFSNEDFFETPSFKSNMNIKLYFSCKIAGRNFKFRKRILGPTNYYRIKRFTKKIVKKKRKNYN